MGDNLSTVDLGTGRTAKALSSAGVHSCVLLDNDSIKCWGYNGNADLGLGDTNNRGDNASEMGDSLPAVDLGTGRTAKAVSSGGGGTCAILDNDTVKCWGYSALGQLGYGDTNNRGDAGGEMGDNLPAVDLGTGRTASSIWYGDLHVCALLDNGSVKCWGWNSAGQLGLGGTDNRGDGLAEMGDNLGSVPLGTGRTALAVTAGYDHSCALLDNDTVKCWGNNADGQLGYGDASWRGDGAGEMGNNLPAVDLGAEPALPATGTDPALLVTLAAILLAVGTALLTSRRRIIGVR
jgi:LPXTG-motif cell wall-anchored protein